LWDSVFGIGCAIYLLNRWVLVPLTGNPFLINWLGDLLLVPCALPLQVAIYHALGLRRRSCPPTGFEILAHVAFWSVLFEVVGPRVLAGATGDPLDVAAYAAGGAAAHLWWRRKLPARSMSAAEGR